MWLTVRGLANPSTNSYPFSGSLDDVRIYNRALSANEIKQYYDATSGGHYVTGTPSRPLSVANANGLVGYWTFDGNDTPWTSATAATTIDRSGSGNTGTLTNMNQSSAPVEGIHGQALQFDGSTNYVSIPNGVISNYPFSVGGWSRYTDSTNNWRNFISLGNSGSTNDYLLIGKVSPLDEPSTNNGIKYRLCKIDVTCGVNIVVDTAYNDGQWHHVMAVSAASNDHKIYIDGKLAGSSTTNVTMPTFNQASIGVLHRSDTVQYWAGSIDDVRIYNRALSGAEIQQLYKAGLR